MSSSRYVVLTNEECLAGATSASSLKRALGSSRDGLTLMLGKSSQDVDGESVGLGISAATN